MSSVNTDDFPCITYDILYHMYIEVSYKVYIYVYLYVLFQMYKCVKYNIKQWYIYI